MYQKFNITSISTDLIYKKIYIEFSLDVKEDTVNESSLVLTNRESGAIIPCKIITKRNVVELELNDWPVPNIEYLLRVQKTILSIVDDQIEGSLQRNIIFKSQIVSSIQIVNPSDHEEMKELIITWKETNVSNSEDLVNSYYLEIANENAFYNIVKDTKIVDRNEILLSGIDAGQYYLRIRAQNEEGQYGRWSDVITFLFSGENKEAGPIFEEDTFEEDSIYEEEFKIINQPENGEDLKTFIIEFEDEVDPDSFKEITLLRRSV